MEISLKDKRALVTGGNSGIGAAMVRAFSEAGAKVAINYVVHPESAQALLRDIRERGGEALTVEADISDPETVAAMFRTIDESWGGIDIVVNNAGIDGVRAFGWESDVAAWRKVIDVNLFGAYYCSREALQRMVPRKTGVIVNLTSVHEEIAWSGYSAYTASKAAISMLTKTLGQEAAPHGVRVVALAPGAIETPINRAVWSSREGLQDLLNKIPMGRIGQPEEVARLAVFLASDWASYLTARTVFLDGGMTDFPSFSHGG